MHTSDAGLFFHNTAKALSSGGALVICDDFLMDGADGAGMQRNHTYLKRWKWGWHIGTLLKVESAFALAAQAGFDHVQATDLWVHLELRKPRDRFIALFAGAPAFVRAKGETARALIGGDALQRSLLSGVVGYHLLVFRRVSG